MAYFAKLDNTLTVVTVVAGSASDDGKELEISNRTDGTYRQTYPDASKRKNYAGIGFTYDRDKDAFVPPQPYPSFVLNETTQRYEPPIPYPQGLPGGPQRFIWDEEHYQEHGEWFDRWDTSDSHSQYNPDSKYYLEDLPKYEDDDYPFDEIEQTW